MIVLNENHRLTTVHHSDPIPQGMDAHLHAMVGRWKRFRKATRYFMKQAQSIKQLTETYQKYSDHELRNNLYKFRELFRRQTKDSQKQLPHALAMISEAVFRTLGFRPFAEQMAGALILFDGAIAEMSTGEGKTVTAAMAAVIRGWIGLPCHVITSNDYLAARDAETMKPLFDFCYVSVSSVTSSDQPQDRRPRYAHDVVYTTAKELLADFLRDRIHLSLFQDASRRMIHLLESHSNLSIGQVVLRGIHTAIIDEADNVLIDEAVTPLIISQEKPNKAFFEACQIAMKIARSLRKEIDYQADSIQKMIWIQKDLTEMITREKGDDPNGFKSIPFQKNLIRQALVALEFFHLNQQYIIDKDEIIIVDESTGRQMPGRSWTDGLHQLIEVKEGVPPTPVKETQARLSFQRFFRFFKVFSGMTGTAWEASREFWQIYNTRVVRIPNHRPCLRKTSPIQFYATSQQKWDAILHEIETVHATGRPLLIGTRHVERSEWLAEKLSQKGLSCMVVNAVRQQEEAKIIANAGQAHAITVATNMAGRGTDIKLQKTVDSLGGLHVIATECHGSYRVDRQLFGRAARQGDPGSARPYSSMEDELIARHLPRFLKMTTTFLQRCFPFASRLLGLSVVRISQFFSERLDFNLRLTVQRTDTWLDNSLSFARDDVQ